MSSPDVLAYSSGSFSKAFEQFDEHGRMRPSSYYYRIVDVIENW